jgi:hypothetical protein
MNVATSVHEPLVLADGTKIDPSTGGAIRDAADNVWTEVPSPSSAQALVVRARRSVNELPMPPQQMNGVALVAFYTLFGLCDTDIALALDGKLTEDQVANIRKLSVYKDFMASAKTNLLETANEQVRDLLQQHALSAAKQVVQHAGSENDVLSFKASQDILDRAGHRPADIVEHRHKLEDALHIVIEHKDDGAGVPMIDITPETIDAD